MIAYFDTSALVPLVIVETSSQAAHEFWTGADRVATSRISYPESRAAVARARRGARISASQLRTAVDTLEELFSRLDIVDLDEVLARRAGDLAETHDLRGFDAVHLASAESTNAPDLVVVASDRSLTRAATAAGLEVAAI